MTKMNENLPGSDSNRHPQGNSAAGGGSAPNGNAAASRDSARTPGLPPGKDRHPRPNEQLRPNGNSGGGRNANAGRPKPRFGLTVLRLLAVFAALHLIWALLSAALKRDILPSPAVVYRALFKLDGGDMLMNIGTSMGRVFAGIALALAVGLALGLIMGRSPRWNRLLDPVVYLTYPVPKIALLPVAMLFLGLGEASKIVMIALILVFQVIISVRDGVKAIPVNTYDVLTSLGAGRMAKFTQITLPGALSSILSTIRISLGTAFSVLFFTEIYGTEHGMGYFIMDAWLRLDYPGMYAGILLFSGVGFLLFVLVDLFEYRFMKWRG